MRTTVLYDAIIIGGGPAGLSAALILGRCRRKVVVFDTGKPRNSASSAMHGYLTRDGMDPKEFLAKARKEIKQYGVEFYADEIVKAECQQKRFTVYNKAGDVFTANKILLATGIKDKLPEIKGVDQLYGKSVYHCPYCDGWEVRDKKLAAYGKRKKAMGLSLSLKTWSNDVILLTDGKVRFTEEENNRLEQQHIKVVNNKIAALEGNNGMLERILFSDGTFLERDAIFFSSGQYQHSDLARQLSCRLNRKEVVYTDRFQQSNVSGVYVAGDAEVDMQLVIVAAAEGAKAGVAINMALQQESQNAH